LGIKLYQEPKLQKPDMIASWPGIGNVGLIAVDTLRRQVRASELGEIESWDFFYPKKVIIKAGIITDLEFPSNRFFYKQLATKDLIFFTGEEQPTDGCRVYAEGEKAFQMANLVLDVAERFDCQRVYTSGAAVSLTHHTLKSRVWAVTSRNDLNRIVKGYENTVLMGKTEVRDSQGSISGLNGLLLGLAKRRGFEAISLMGEIPDYLSGVPFPYPKASKSVLEVLTSILGLNIDYVDLDGMAMRVDDIIEGIYEKFPPEIKERVEQRRTVLQGRPETITEEDESWIKEHIDELFKKGGSGDERPA
jgi:proteasome assembly chaperone (PAC2) family protein